LLGQVTNHALGISTLGHLFDKGGLDRITKLGLDGLAALVVRGSGLGAAAGLGSSFLPQPTKTAAATVLRAASFRTERLDTRVMSIPSGFKKGSEKAKSDYEPG
jgi:hypothetical protein